MFKLLLISSLFLFHPVHVTLTSIDYIPEEGYYKVFVRMYLDDYIIDNKQNGGVISEQDFSVDKPTARIEVEQFLSKKLIIKVNNKRLSGRMLDIKKADNEISIDMEFREGSKPESVYVKNMIMTELYSDQLNMLIVRVNDFEEGVKLTSDLSEHTFIIK